jgi:hypothetical protein
MFAWGAPGYKAWAMKGQSPWKRSPSGDVCSVSIIVANPPPGLDGRLVLNGPSTAGIVGGAMTSKRD